MADEDVLEDQESTEADTAESENVDTVKDIESEIAALSNDKNGPYWNRTHPDHDKVVQQVYTLREMLNAK